MAIFPRFESQRVAVPTPETPAPPALTRGAETLIAGGRALLAGGLQAAEVVRKRQALEDDTLVMERYMMAAAEIEESEEQMKLGGADAERARERADELLSKRSPEWMRGLRPDAAFKLETKLFQRSLDFRTSAARVANRALFDRYSAGMVGRERAISEGIAKGRIADDPELSQEYKDYLEDLAVGVGLGAVTREKAEQEQVRVLTNSALDLGHQMSTNDPQRLLDMPRNSGFMKHLTASQETQLRAQAEATKRTRERDAEHQEDRRRALMDRFTNEQREYFEAEAEKRLRGDRGSPPLTVEWLDQMNELRFFTGEKYRFYRDAIEQRLVEGGPGDPQTIRDLGVRVMMVDDNQAVRAAESDVMESIRARKVPFRTGMAWLQHLRTKASAEDTPMRRENSAVKQLVQEALRVRGPMAQTVDPVVQPVLTEALEDLERNAAAGYPVSPLQLYSAKKAEWQARARVPAVLRLNELRRSLGLPARSADTGDRTILEAREKLAAEWRATPYGDTAKRDRIMERTRRLKELYDLEEQVYQFSPGARRGGAQPAQSTQQQPKQGGRTLPPGAR